MIKDCYSEEGIKNNLGWGIHSVVLWNKMFNWIRQNNMHPSSKIK